MMRTRTILLVDDDSEARSVIAAMLEEPGYTILQAENGYEAVGMLAEHWVDLLITDVRMSGLDGFELARQAKVMRPTIAVIYMSGYAKVAEGRTFGELIVKPIRLADLMQTVAHALA